MSSKVSTKRYALSCFFQQPTKKQKTSLKTKADSIMDKLDNAMNCYIASYFPGVCKVGRYSSFDVFYNIKGKRMAAPKKVHSAEEQEWEVASIVGHRMYADGDADFLILWKETDPLFPGVNVADLPFFPVLSVITFRYAWQDIHDMLADYIEQNWDLIEKEPIYVNPNYVEYTNYFS